MTHVSNYTLHTKADGTTWHKGLCISSAVIGKNGIVLDKREGDWGTPVGVFNFVTLYYRPDRVARPATNLPVVAMTPEMGWCDDAAHPLYNQPVELPFEAGHEKLWMEPSMYDLMVTTSHNQNPIIPNLGSAIFIHLLGPKPYTAGCLAIDTASFLRVMETAGPKDAWCIDGS